MNGSHTPASGIASRVKTTPGVLGGSACIGDTRIAVWMLVRARQLGLGDEQLRSWFVVPLEQADLDAAWAYYDDHREEIDRAIRENEED